MKNCENSKRPSAQENKSRKKKKSASSGSSMPHWCMEAASAIETKKPRTQLDSQRRSAQEKVVKGLAETAQTKQAGLEFLEVHNLPRYAKVSVDLERFVEKPEHVFAQLPSPTGLYYTSVVNLETGARTFGLEHTQEMVKEFIAEKLINKEITLNSKLVLSEYWHNYYGGNLIISRDGRVFVELVKGKHEQLVKGKGKILMTAETNMLMGLLKFDATTELADQEETKLRQSILDALSLIPKHSVALTEGVVKSRFQEPVVNDQGEQCTMLPYDGYYEFILTKANPDIANWSVIFLDARVGRDADKYQLAE